ncbi:hypothetical protein, partial [Rhizobium sp. UGM030330-04]|uniref:hypothetical protein n=2 Tax=Rhizobium sp. UGM030330-04 TaxID=1378077 RepID=UPI001AECFC13
VCKTQHQIFSLTKFGPADTKGPLMRPFVVQDQNNKKTPRASLKGDKSPSAICSGTKHNRNAVTLSRQVLRTCRWE